MLGLEHFDDDPLRSLLYFARGVGYRATGVPFQEFFWAQWLREETGFDLRIRHEQDQYLELVEQVTRAQSELRPDTVVAAGLTAGDLGALRCWNDGEPRDGGRFGRLAAPYEHARPGKLAYALEFRQLQARQPSAHDLIRAGRDGSVDML